MDRTYFTYILTNWRNSVLYIGVTGNLVGRIEQHKAGEGSKFTKRYRTTKLVHVESFEDAYNAICREKQLKSWARHKKEELINRNNPNWKDLSEQILC